MAESCVFYAAGQKVCARLRRPSAGPAPGVVICHGYSGSMDEYEELAAFLCAAGYATLQFDARGTGHSDGLRGNLLCATQWLEDAAAAVGFLASRPGVDAGRIAAVGSSIGGASVVWLAAADARVKRAVALAPMADGPALLRGNWLKNHSEAAFLAFLRELEEKERDGAATGRLLADISVMRALDATEKETLAYDTIRKENPEMVSKVTAASVQNSFVRYAPAVHAPRVRAATLIIHGDADELVNPAMGKALYEAIPAEKQFFSLPGAPHNIPAWPGHRQAYDQILEWLKPL